MDLFWSISLLILWFIVLIKWADILVEWSSSIAKKFGISSLVIGLTIVAFGTSAPELVVNIMAAMKQETDLAISNIVGSNISNILLILWITAMIYPIKMASSTVKKEVPFALLTAVILLIMLSDQLLWKDSINILSRVDSLILLSLFCFFLYYTFMLARKSKAEKKEEENIELMPNYKAILFIIWWLVWLTIGWNLIVDNAVSIAKSFWVPNSFIWVTIVAIGTSLPELATSVVAAMKKNTDMAIWNIVWSNIFNTIWILWATWLIYPLAWYEGLYFDLAVNILATILILVFAFSHRKYFIDKHEWLIFVVLYFSYMTYLVLSL